MSIYGLLVVILFFWPMHAMAIGSASFSSKIPGMQLWQLSTSATGFPEEYFEGNDSEFISYCDGTRSLYVSSYNLPVPCKSDAISGDTYRIQLNTKNKDISDLVVVSKKPLQSRVKALPLTPEESKRLGKAEAPLRTGFAKEAKRSYLESYQDADTVYYEKYLQIIRAGTLYRKYGRARAKLSSPKGFIYISAVGLFPDAMGWNIKNVVFREIDGALQVIGTFMGCIEGFRDLNEDGTPEVLTSLCENGEGTDHRYWSLTPKIEPVLWRSQ